MCVTYPLETSSFDLICGLQAISTVFFRHSTYDVSGVMELSKVARTKQDALSQPFEDFYSILIQLNNLSAEVDAAELEHTLQENLGLFIEKSLHVDANLRSWAISLGPLWQYTVVDDVSPSPLGDHTHFPVISGKYHVYQNIAIASMWNHYRQTRIVVNEMIRSMSFRLWEINRTPECQQTMIQSIAIIQQMADEICTSISYCFQHFRTIFAAAFRVLWPLFIAAKSMGTEPTTREWILLALDRIGNTTGIQQAINMAQVIRLGIKLPIIPGTWELENDRE
jgi:hypothetical protein